MEKNLKEFKVKLEKKVKESSRIFIVPHMNIDFDAIGAASGMAEICAHLKRENFLVVDDEISNMDIGIRSIYDKVKERYSVISSKEMKDYHVRDDLLITVDVGKRNLLSTNIELLLSTFSNRMVLDHHKEDEYSILVEDRYIDTNTSSTCEMVARLLRMFGVPIDQWLAKALLAGIFLDTNKLKQNTTEKTLEIAARLIRRGTSIQDVNALFVEDFEKDRKIQHLIDGTEFISYRIHNVAIIVNQKQPNTIYTQAELAAAADYLLPYKVDASYAIGLTAPNQVGISARTTGGMNVAEIMHVLGGGGNEYSAATQIFHTDDVFFVREKLIQLLRQEEFYFGKGMALVAEVENQKREETTSLMVLPPVDAEKEKCKKLS